jgi:hypothetical protein
VRDAVIRITADADGDTRARATYYLRFLGDLDVAAVRGRAAD